MHTRVMLKNNLRAREESPDLMHSHPRLSIGH
jgi:hypothetical protein